MRRENLCALRLVLFDVLAILPVGPCVAFSILIEVLSKRRESGAF